MYLGHLKLTLKVVSGDQRVVTKEEVVQIGCVLRFTNFNKRWQLIACTTTTHKYAILSPVMKRYTCANSIRCFWLMALSKTAWCKVIDVVSPEYILVDRYRTFALINRYGDTSEPHQRLLLMRCLVPASIFERICISLGCLQWRECLGKFELIQLTIYLVMHGPRFNVLLGCWIFHHLFIFLAKFHHSRLL